MIFNCILISLHEKKQIYISFFVLFIIVTQIWSVFHIISRFIISSLFSHFLYFVNILELDLNFGDFHLLDVITNMLLKSFAFIISLNIHLYQSNINLKIDISYSLLLP